MKPAVSSTSPSTHQARHFRGPRYPVASAQVDKEEGRRRAARPEKANAKKKPGEGRPTPEDRERGKWRWDGNDDY